MAVFYGMLEHWTILSAFAILCVVCWYYWSHWKVLQAAWRFPNVGFLPALPIVGHGYLALRGTDWVMSYVSEAIKKLVSKGCFDKMIYWCGPYPVFFLFDPQEIQVVLNSTKSLERGASRKLLKCFLGDGLIAASVDVWKVTRRHVNVMFRPRNLELVFPKLNEVGRDLVSGLADHLHSGLFDVEPVVNPFALKSSCTLVFPQEVKFDVNSTTFRNALEAITWCSQIYYKRFVTPYMWPDSTFMLLYKNCVKHIDDTVDTFIHEANEASSKHTKNEYHDRDHTDRKTQIILEDVYKTLHQNYPSFTEQYYNHEVRNILAAGSESTRVTLSSCLVALAANPNVQSCWYLWIPGHYSWYCQKPIYGPDPVEDKIVGKFYLFMWSRILDLLDTVFMVLKKNNHQISFLHLYHHSVIATECWICVKYMPGGHVAFVGTLNAFVHVVMYFYYFLTAYDASYKKSIWWKRHITELQLVQFFILLVQQLCALFSPSCDFPKYLTAFFISQAVLMIYLFSKFYSSAYVVKDCKKSKKS